TCCRSPRAQPSFPTRRSSDLMTRIPNNRAWWLVLPVFLLVAFSAVLPMMTVVNYSVQDIFDSSTRFFVGADWYRQVLQDPRLHDSLLRQFIFSGCVLLIEIPLGILIALSMPRGGRWASLCLIIMAIPLLIPWNVVGTIWQIFGRADIGLLGWTLTKLDRKSTRLNSSHVKISYAVFCLKKKTK